MFTREGKTTPMKSGKGEERESKGRKGFECQALKEREKDGDNLMQFSQEGNKCF